MAGNELEAARQLSLKCLARRGYLTHELEQQLAKKLFSQETIAQVIQEFRSKGYLNDEEWIEHFVTKQLARKVGPAVILMKLRGKGVSTDLATEIIKRFEDPEREIGTVVKLLQTRYRKYDLMDYMQKGKVIASLMRKGFSHSDIQEALRREQMSER